MEYSMDMRNIGKIFLDIFFPCLCASCSRPISEGLAICEDCFLKIKTEPEMRCAVCFSRIPEGTSSSCHNEGVIFSACRYEGLMKNIITLAKFKKSQGAAKLAGFILAGALEKANLNLSDFCLVEIPLHPARQKERGFNQSHLIAKEVGEILNLPLLNGALERVRDTKPQTSLKSKERKSNMEGAFVGHKEVLSGKNILLIDDVSTTGATLREASRAAKNALCNKIVGVSVCS